MKGEFGLRFQVRRIERAKDVVEERPDSEVVAHNSRGRTMFVGEYGAVNTLFVQCLKDLFCPGKQRDAVEHVFVPEFSVDWDGAGHEVCFIPPMRRRMAISKPPPITPRTCSIVGGVKPNC